MVKYGEPGSEITESHLLTTVTHITVHLHQQLHMGCGLVGGWQGGHV